MEYPLVRVVNGIPRIGNVRVTTILRAAAEGTLHGVDPDHVAEARRFALAAFDEGTLPPGVSAEEKGLLKLLSALTDPVDIKLTDSPSEGLVEQVAFKDYLVLIQDFSTALNNPEACFTLVAREAELDAATSRLMSAGQRHPGMVVQVFLTNDAAPSRDKLPIPMTEFEIWRGAFIVLAHCPSRANFERMCINAAYPREAASLDKARAAYFDRPVFTLFGCLIVVGDSENREADGIAMKPGEAMAWSLPA